MDPTHASIRSLQRLIGPSDISPTAVTAAFVERAQLRNAASRSFITISSEQALEAAEAIERRCAAGPLAGVPFACKDVFNTVDIPTTAGSRAMHDYHASDDAIVIQRLRAAGAILIGKNNLHEFCYGITGENAAFGTPRNPHDPARIAGGSSSGSAVAVAERTVVFALGTDTGGSVRVPAALCGVVGLKPTMGRIDTRGVVPFCWSLDHVGILAKTSADVAEVFKILAQRENVEADYSVAQPAESIATSFDGSLHGLRIGVPQGYFLERIDPEIRTAIDGALAACRSFGARVVELRSPDMTHVRIASLAIQLVEAFTWHRSRMEARSELYGEDVRDGLIQGQFILAEHYVQSLRLMEMKRRELTELLQGVDVMLTPTTPIVAPRRGIQRVTLDGIEEPVGNVLSRFTCLFNLTGHPALSVPIGRHSTGLPIGMQLIGPHFREARLLRIARAMERVGIAGWIDPSVGDCGDQANPAPKRASGTHVH